MSRIGKQPVIIPAGTTVAINGSTVTVTGPKGTLNLEVPQKITVEVKDDQVNINALSSDKKVRSNWGTIRAHIQNMVKGVNEPYKKELEIRGTGYKASLNGNKLTLNVGYIHPVHFVAPEGIFFNLPDETHVTVTGADKTLVGQLASNIRKVKKPEPYKGKGIRYVDEVIKLKAGKTAKA